MRRAWLTAAAVAIVAGLGLTASAAPRAPESPATTAAEVIARNVTARGGLEAWRKVNTMVWFGHVERVSSPGMHIPFVLQIRRPNSTRFEIKERFDQFTRIFAGDHGWKVRPGNNGQPSVKTFSKEEIAFSKDEFPLDGPLIDYQAKGVTAVLDGIDTVDSRKAYRLSLKLASGAERKVWIDTETNLELRYDRPATSPLAPGKPVATFYGGYATVGGLKIPNSIVSTPSPDPAQRAAADRLVIDRFDINPTLDDQSFLPPPTPMHRGGKVQIPSNGMPTDPRRPGGP